MGYILLKLIDFYMWIIIIRAILSWIPHKITGIDPYALEGGIEAMARQLPRINVARLYQVLKK